MRKEDWTVTKKGSASPISPDQCTWCRAEFGEQHKPDCVVRTRTVVVELTIKYVVTVPESWTVEQIEFHRNESSWCVANAFDELQEQVERWEVDQCCGVCGSAAVRFVREATEQDEEDSRLFVKDQEG